MTRSAVKKARREMEQAITSILRGIMRDCGADLLMDKTRVVRSTGDLDITATAVQRLDRKLSRLKIELANPPVGIVGSAH
jgi:hypothetical protein